MDRFETMGKAQLRAACKEAGIKNYGKMNNDGMRLALCAIEAARIQAGAAKNKTTKHGLKIEKNREERNGIKRPSTGSKCRAIWDAIDGLQSELEIDEKVTIAMVKDLSADEGWNLNNAVIEFYRWRRFNSRGE